MNAPSNSTQLANPFSKWFEPHEKLSGKSFMDHLYNRLDGAYPHKWRSNFASPEAIDNWSVSWAEAFEEECVTPEMIKAGLKACRSQFEWPPSCAEFIKSCKTIQKQEPSHVMALPAPRSANADKEAKAMMEKLGAGDVLKNKTDHKLWAKRIIAKSKQPLNGLTALQIRFAKEALDNTSIA